MMKKRGNALSKLFTLTAVAVFLFYRTDPFAVMAAESETEEAPVLEVEPETEEASVSEVEPETEEAFVSEVEPVMEEAPAPEVEPEQSVSTGSELTAWLEVHKNTGGTVKLSDNVVLDEDYSFCPNGANMPAVLVDTDKYTITVAGEIELLSDNHLIFSGQPEGKGIFNVAPQGMLSMEGITVESEKGALWQEEGAGLVVSNCSVSGNIHYADKPFVTYYKNSICAVVEKGQTVNDVLPLQISCTVNREGQLFSNESVSISWNTEGTEKQQEERRRFEIQGSFINATSAEMVFCTVVYNDYPLTFTDVQASANGFSYTFQGGFTAPAESLPFTVMSEYSFDGENWILFDTQTASNIDAWFFIACKHEQRDSAAQSDIYIRLQWDNNGIKYFSNVLRYSTENLDVAEDIGGSRGGGVSIVKPPVEPVSPEVEDPEQDTGDGAPPKAEDPEQNTGDDAPPKVEEPEQGTGGDTLPENTESKDNSSATKETKGKGRDSQQTETAAEASCAEYAGTDTGQLANADSSNAGQEPQSQAEVSNTDSNINEDHTDKTQPSDTGHSTTSERQVLYAESNAIDIASLNRSDIDINKNVQENLAAASVNESSAESLSKASEQAALHTDNRQGSHIIIAAGFVLLSAGGGMAGFYVHSRSGTKR